LQAHSSAAQPLPDLERLGKLQPLHSITGRNRTKATVLFYRVDGFGVALKSYEASPALIRLTLGRWLTRREAAAFRFAAGAPGVPAFLGRPRPWAIATEWVEGRTLAELENSAVSVEVLERLGSILEGLHSRGVALWDLHHRDVLVSADGSVHVVDLALARTLGDRPGRLRRFLFEQARDADRVALARIRAKYTGEDVEEAVAAVGASAAAWHRRGRRVKRAVNWLRGKGAPDGVRPASNEDEEESPV